LTDAAESFSQVIKAHFGPQPTAGRFLARARAARISDDALDAMDGIVRTRVKELARAAKR
jgi:hypothetical protein